jgi:hypothetical protein
MNSPAIIIDVTLLSNVYCTGGTAKGKVEEVCAPIYAQIFSP